MARVEERQDVPRRGHVEEGVAEVAVVAEVDGEVGEVKGAAGRQARGGEVLEEHGLRVLVGDVAQLQAGRQASKQGCQWGARAGRQWRRQPSSPPAHHHKDAP